MSCGMMENVRTIENPLGSGACSECVNHYKWANGKDMCAKNHIGILTRVCSKIPVCSLFRRNYRAGASEMKG